MSKVNENPVGEAIVCAPIQGGLAMLKLNIVKKVMDATKKYTVVDYGFFKFLMITFGMLLGVYYTEAILDFLGLIWAIFIVSAVWMIYKIFKYTK